MNDVTGTVDARPGVGPDHESAVWIDAVGDALHVALLAQQHANRATERVAALGIGGGQGGVISGLRLPSAVEEFERGKHGGDDRRTRWRQLAASSRAAIASDVALGTGSWSSARPTLMPMPTTQAGPWQVSTRSERMPHTLRLGNQHVVGPLEHCRQVSRAPHAVADREARQQRQPGPAARIDTVRPHQDGHRDARAWRRGPGTALPAAAGRLVVGDQHGARGFALPGTGRQIGIRRAGLRRPDRSSATSRLAGSAPAGAPRDRSRHRSAYRDPSRCRYLAPCTSRRSCNWLESGAWIVRFQRRTSTPLPESWPTWTAGCRRRSMPGRLPPSRSSTPRARRRPGSGSMTVAGPGLIHRAGRVRPASLDIVRHGEAATLRRRGDHRLRHHRGTAGMRVQPGRDRLRGQPGPGVRREDRQDHRLCAEDGLPD